MNSKRPTVFSVGRFFCDRRIMKEGFMCGSSVDKNTNADSFALYYLNDFVGTFSAGCFEGDLIAHRLSHEGLSQW